MKRKMVVVLTACLFIIATVSVINAFDFPGMKKKDDKAAVDVGSLSNRSATVLKCVSSATLASAEGVVNIQMALGREEEAEKLQQVINNTKEKKGDKNATKALVAEMNNATADLETVDLQANLDKSEASKYIGLSLLNIGAGILLDGIATKIAADLLKESQAALKHVSLNTVVQVKDVIDVSQFVVQEVPPQTKNLYNYSVKLTDYANTNGIPTPSKEDIEKKLKDLQEE